MGQNREEVSLDVLENTIALVLKLDDLRIVVNCFKAVSYMMKFDNESYLDTRALVLKARLERIYSELLLAHSNVVETTAP